MFKSMLLKDNISTYWKKNSQKLKNTSTSLIFSTQSRNSDNVDKGTTYHNAIYM